MHYRVLLSRVLIVGLAARVVLEQPVWELNLLTKHKHCILSLDSFPLLFYPLFLDSFPLFPNSRSVISSDNSVAHHFCPITCFSHFPSSFAHYSPLQHENLVSLLPCSQIFLNMTSKQLNHSNHQHLYTIATHNRNTKNQM